MTIEIDHISLSVADYEKAKAFYAAALAPMRISVMMEFPMDGGSSVAGLGADGKPFLWISDGGKTAQPAHIAIRAEDEAQVDAFYAAAMAAGGTDNGAPGPRPHYHQNYYAAFVLDPDGNNIEAVIHTHGLKAKPARAARAGKSVGGRKAARKAGSRAASKKPTRRSAAKKPVKRAAAKRPTTRKKPTARGKKKAR
jgi:catechol 2,3-dioxygenase-like lactoylglutathione lyase family enzyme